MSKIKRVLVKLSGEALIAPDGYWLNPATLSRLAADLAAAGGLADMDGDDVARGRNDRQAGGSEEGMSLLVESKPVAAMPGAFAAIICAEPHTDCIISFGQLIAGAAATIPS